MKISNIIFLVILILVVVAVAGYFCARYYFSTQGPEYLFVHPTIAKILQISPVCPMVCPAGGVCGKDGKNYCNQCLALQNRAGFDHNGPCLKTYTNKNFGFSITFTDSWKDYSVVISSWNGQLIDGPTKYSGETLIFKNQKLADQYHFQGIPIMIFTPDVWKLVSEEKIAVSAAPIGPAKVGENSKYVFATPPRYIGFGDELNTDQINEVYDIVKTFKAF